MIKGIHRLMRSRRGDAAIEFIMVAAMLILTFAMLVSALVYVVQVYSASYITRRVVRYVETTGEYNEREVRDLVNELGGHALDNTAVEIEASYVEDRKIQLRSPFRITLTADYSIKIAQFGRNAVTVRLPIKVSLAGRSEVFWK